MLPAEATVAVINGKEERESGTEASAEIIADEEGPGLMGRRQEVQW